MKIWKNSMTHKHSCSLMFFNLISEKRVSNYDLNCTRYCTEQPVSRIYL